ncbi:hypothetical protein OG474_20400 [Kribbella sp. NBC_01505]|uniref:hypothetical protein n=1 Tax=Kribbella sp. NBC_01505 TaxID=2903580 RepID=UPI003870BB2C
MNDELYMNYPEVERWHAETTGQFTHKGDTSTQHVHDYAAMDGVWSSYEQQTALGQVMSTDRDIQDNVMAQQQYANDIQYSNEYVQESQNRVYQAALALR